MRYRWLLFDLDGTLFDFERAEEDALSEVLARYGLPTERATRELYRDINRELWLELENGTITAGAIKVERFRRLLEQIELPAAPERLSEAYLESLGTQTHLLPGAERLIGSLDGQVRLALVTNGLSVVQRPRLRHSGMGPRFEVVVVSEEVGWAKPDARIFELALARMGSPPKRSVLMVGDNPQADIEGARRAGLDTCWVNLGARQTAEGVDCTFEIHHLNELLPN